MKKALFENAFMVTETLQNGKERRIKKVVYSDRFVDGRFYTEVARIEKATQLLRENHYYNIEFLYSKPTSLLMI